MARILYCVKATPSSKDTSGFRDKLAGVVKLLTRPGDSSVVIPFSLDSSGVITGVFEDPGAAMAVVRKLYRLAHAYGATINVGIGAGTIATSRVSISMVTGSAITRSMVALKEAALKVPLESYRGIGVPSGDPLFNLNIDLGDDPQIDNMLEVRAFNILERFANRSRLRMICYALKVSISVRTSNTDMYHIAKLVERYLDSKDRRNVAKGVEILMQIDSYPRHQIVRLADLGYVSDGVGEVNASTNFSRAVRKGEYAFVENTLKESVDLATRFVDV